MAKPAVGGEPMWVEAVKGFVKLLENLLPLIEVGILDARADKFVGGVVPELLIEFAEVGEVMNEFELFTKVIGEVAKWRDWDMDLVLGIEIDRGAGAAEAEFAFERAGVMIADVWASRTLSIDEVDFDLLWWAISFCYCVFFEGVAVVVVVSDKRGDKEGCVSGILCAG